MSNWYFFTASASKGLSDFFLQTTVPDKLCKLFSTKKLLTSIKGEAQRNLINLKGEEWEFLKENKIIIYIDIVS